MHDLVGWILGILFYLYISVCLYSMAEQVGSRNSWFAFLPILDLILMLEIADMPIWWLLLLFIPIVNIIAGALVWMSICRALRKPAWLGILVFLPGVNLVVLGYLAWARS
jgi:hypothetical protein